MEPISDSSAARKVNDFANGQVNNFLDSVEDLGVEFLLPEDFKSLALGVVVEDTQTHEGLLVAGGRQDDIFDEALAGADAHECAGGEAGFGHGVGAG